MTLTLESAAFANYGPLPARYTCEGNELSPPLRWSGIPDFTRSLALILEDVDAPDPNAPALPHTHWVVFNMPPDIEELTEGTVITSLSEAAGEGLNDGHSTGYQAPCPTIGQHRYVFTLYALDDVLTDLQAPTKTQLESAMSGHVIDSSELTTSFERAE